MIETTFRIKGYGRKPVVIAKRTRRGEKIDYQWMKPAHVVDAMRKVDPIITMGGEHVYPFRNFAELAQEVDRCDAAKVYAALQSFGFVPWCAGQWGQSRSEARNILLRLSNTAVLDHVKQYKAEVHAILL